MNARKPLPSPPRSIREGTWRENTSVLTCISIARRVFFHGKLWGEIVVLIYQILLVSQVEDKYSTILVMAIHGDDCPACEQAKHDGTQ